MEGFNQGREAANSPWLLNKEYRLQGARLEAGTQLVRLVECPKEGDVWTEVVAVQKEHWEPLPGGLQVWGRGMQCVYVGGCKSSPPPGGV